MKIITVLGTRPEFIRLSVIIKKMDQLFGKDHILVNTGQNFKHNLSTVFIKDLEIREPDYTLDVKSDSTFERIGSMIKKLGEVFEKEDPDFSFVLGDTYTSFAGVFVSKHFRKKSPTGTTVFHFEGGNRSFDKRVPEETNRLIVDHISNYNLCYTKHAKENLEKEGLIRNTFVTGNPIFEVINFYKEKINRSNILSKLNLVKNDYILVTFHRDENVSNPQRLSETILALSEIAKTYNKIILFSTHPKTQDKIREFNIDIGNIKFEEPFGFLDFHKLLDNAFLVASDSGTVPEECCIKKIPNIILREATERTEILEHGGSVLVGTTKKENIIRGATLAINSKLNWQTPSEYLIEDVSDRVLTLIVSHINSKLQNL